jgi:CBS domain-containing protein
MLVRDVMTSPVVTVRPNLPLKQVARLLDSHSVTALPVIDTHGRILGVISEADVLLEAVPRDPRLHEIPTGFAETPAFVRTADVMNHHPITVSPTTDVADAVDLMTSTSVKSLPVVENDVVVGVVSRRDVVRLLARTDENLAAEVDELLRDLDDDWMIDVHDGVVLATGPDDQHQRDLVRGLAATVPGVVAVRFI